MRTCLAFALVLAACGGTNPGGDDDVTPDAPDNPPANGFRITTPDYMIPANTEITVCYYFRTPNTKAMAIKKWSSNMTDGSHHMIYFGTQSDAGTPGTFQDNCEGFGLGGGGTIWTYAAQNAVASIELPADDGTGQPLAQQINANSAGFFQMHYLNTTSAPLAAHVTLDAEALDEGAPFTKTSAFVTYNNSINIPSGAVNDVESMTCGVPAGAKFWMMSTHAHKQATKTAVKDGARVVFESLDWEHPGAAMFMTPSTFETFSTGRITYECTYTNTTGRTINSGQSAATDEMCMASGYYFPAPKPMFCFDNQGPFSPP